MAPLLDGGAMMLLLLFASTLAVVSLLLLLQMYIVCFLNGPPPTPPDNLPAARVAEAAGEDLRADAPAAGGAAPLPGASCAWSGDEEAGDCVVCLSALEDPAAGAAVRVLPRCRHAFHSGCIGRWLASHSVCCPLCRTPVPPRASPAATVTSPPPPPPPSVTAAADGGGEEAASAAMRRLIHEQYWMSEELHLPLLLLC